jgi:hypothetical protein
MPTTPPWATYASTFDYYPDEENSPSVEHTNAEDELVQNINTLIEAGFLPKSKKPRIKKVEAEVELKKLPKNESVITFLLTTTNEGQVFFKIFNQCNLFGKYYKASNGYAIMKENSPALEGNCIYVQGSSIKSRDRMCAYACGSKESAENYKGKILEALVEVADTMRESPVQTPLFSRCDIYDF